MASPQPSSHPPSAAPVAAREAARWELYRLLGEPNRLRILALAELDELAVSELAELLRESQPKVSRHCSALREAGLLAGRKKGSWMLLRLAPGIGHDPVVADAIAVGRRLCDEDGSRRRVGSVIAARDRATRAFFAQRGETAGGPPHELAAYLHLLAPLLPRRRLAVDAGTGDGSSLEVLAPLFDKVIAIDRAEAQLEAARDRADRRDFDNVELVCGELDGPELRSALDGALEATQRAGADVVFAVRVLHHAPAPQRAMQALASLAAPPRDDDEGGWVLVLDYLTHEDEALRKRQADLWMGFEPDELRHLASTAGLTELRQGTLPGAWNGEGPDRHLTWQWLAGRRGPGAGSNDDREGSPSPPNNPTRSLDDHHEEQ